ncbi:MAG: hypothetical protein Q8S35_02135 [bacterium]|nr:hypothetical protein [bacterium]
MNPDTTSQGEASVRPQRNPKVVLVVVLIVAMVLIAAGYLFHRYGPQLSFQGLHYLAGSYEERALYKVGLFGTKLAQLPVTGKVIDYAQADRTKAAIIDTGDGVQAVYLLSPGTARVLNTTPGIRASLAVSADGTKVAYAERLLDAPQATASEFYNPTSWVIRVIDTVTGEVATMGNGFGTGLFVRDGSVYLVYGTQEGMHIANLTSGQHQDVTFGVPEDVRQFPIVVSDDGSHVAIPSPAAVYTLFALEQESGVFTLRSIGALPEQARAVAFRNDSIFSASRSTVETFLYKSPVASPETPSAWSRIPYVLITKLIP